MCGRFIVAASTTGSVFVCSAYPDKEMKVLGYISTSEWVGGWGVPANC